MRTRALHAPHDQAPDRLAEVADLLALGLLRHKLRRGRKIRRLKKRAENSLDVFAHQSVHGIEPGPDGEKP